MPPTQATASNYSLGESWDARTGYRCLSMNAIGSRSVGGGGGGGGMVGSAGIFSTGGFTG